MNPIDTRAGFALDVNGLNGITRSRDKGEQVQAVAEQFEALFLNQVMKSMRDAVPRSDLIDSSNTRFYESLFDQQLSSHLAGRGLGLAEQLVQHLSGGNSAIPESLSDSAKVEDGPG